MPTTFENPPGLEKFGVVVVPVTGRWTGATAFYHGDAVVYRWAGNVAPEDIAVLVVLGNLFVSVE